MIRIYQGYKFGGFELSVGKSVSIEKGDVRLFNVSTKSYVDFDLSEPSEEGDNNVYICSLSETETSAIGLGVCQLEVCSNGSIIICIKGFARVYKTSKS